MPSTMPVDQSIESYNWIIPINNVRGIITQLQALRKSLENETGARSSVVERMGSEA